MTNDVNSMIIVTDQYGRQLTILTNHLPKTPQFFEDGHFEQLDGLLTYEFSTLASDPDTKHLVAGNNVIVRNKDRKLMLFTIIRTVEERKDNKYVRRVFAENAAVDDLYNHIVDGQALVAVTAKDAAEKVLAGTGWKLGIVDYAGLQNVNLHEYPTALAALHQIRDQYGLEMEFTVSFMGMKVRDRFVHLVKRRGNVTGKRFTYGKDLTGVTREVDRSDIATAIIPIGKADQTGKRLTIEAFENIHDGYVSPKGQKWVGDEHAMQLYGKNGKHLFKRLDLNSVDNEYELMKKAVEELKRVKQPRATYEVSVLLLESLTGYEHEKVRLGDTILVKDTMFEPALAVNARVIAIYRSYTNPAKDYVLLGEFVPLVIDKNRQIEAIQETINQNMTKWEQGGEFVYKSATEPLPSKRTPDMLWL
ncbi:phage tail spike protein, partial [Bacillus cereus]|uniref:phage tail spike protein n=6 Tax=Bacillaceae TaxID=186817 RepID=UPI000C037F46